MNGRYILDSKGNPKEEDDLIVWAKWFESADRTVKKTVVGEVAVSTVFYGYIRLTGLDHSFDGKVPTLYETMIFGGEYDGEQERCATKEEAKAQHDAWVKKLGEIR